MLDDPTFLLLAGGILASGTVFLFDAAARDRRHGWRRWLWPLATALLACVFVAKAAGRGEGLMLAAMSGLVLAAASWTRDSWSVRGAICIVLAAALVFAGENGVLPRELAIGMILMVAGLGAATSSAAVVPRAIATLALVGWGILTTPSLEPTLGHLGPAVGPLLGPILVTTLMLAALSASGALPERDWLTHPHRARSSPDSVDDTARSWVWAAGDDLRFTTCPAVLDKALRGQSGGRRRSDPAPTLLQALDLCPSDPDLLAAREAIKMRSPFGPMRIEWTGGRSSRGGGGAGTDRVVMTISGTPAASAGNKPSYKGELSLVPDADYAPDMANGLPGIDAGTAEVLHLVDAGLLILDRDARISLLTPTLAQFLGLDEGKAEHLIGRPLFTLLRALATLPSAGGTVPEALARGLLGRIDPTASAKEAPAFTWSLPDGRRARVSVRTLPAGGLVATFSELPSDAGQDTEVKARAGATRP